MLRQPTVFPTRCIVDLIVSATVGRYADVALDIETARLLVFNAARLKETGQPFIKEVLTVRVFRLFVRTCSINSWAPQLWRLLTAVFSVACTQIVCVPVGRRQWQNCIAPEWRKKRPPSALSGSVVLDSRRTCRWKSSIVTPKLGASIAEFLVLAFTRTLSRIHCSSPRCLVWCVTLLFCFGRSIYEGTSNIQLQTIAKLLRKEWV